MTEFFQKMIQSLRHYRIRSSRPEVFCEKDVTLLKKRLWHKCFPVNFVIFLRTPFLTEHRLLLKDFFFESCFSLFLEGWWYISPKYQKSSYFFEIQETSTCHNHLTFSRQRKRKSFPFSSIDKSTVMKVMINILKHKKTTQNTDIPVKILKFNCEFYAEYIFSRFNEPICSPVLKNGSRD